MLIRGTVDQVVEKKFDNGNQLQQICVLESFTSGKHALTWVQLWNGKKTYKTGDSIDCEVNLRIERFTAKDGRPAVVAKLMVV